MVKSNHDRTNIMNLNPIIEKKKKVKGPKPRNLNGRGLEGAISYIIELKQESKVGEHWKRN